MATQEQATEAQWAELRKPFPRESVGLLPRVTVKDGAKSKCQQCGGYLPPHIHLDYVGHAAVTDRLLHVDPSWAWEPVACGDDGLPKLDRDGGLWIRLTVLGVSRLGYGDSQGKTGANAVKEAIGDAIRNAAMRFGVALDLWTKDELESQIDAPELKNEKPTTAVVPPTPPVEPQSKGVATLTTDQIAELMSLARHKGMVTKEEAVRFLNETLGTTNFTLEREGGFEAAKKRVIAAGWKKSEGAA